MNASLSRNGSFRARPGARATALGGALAVTLALAACGSSGEDGAATSPAASGTAAPTTAVDIPAPEAGLARDPAAPVPSSALFAGVEEAWTVPGTAMADTAGSLSADRSMIGMWTAEDPTMLQVFEVAAGQSEPLWEGRCMTAHWWGNLLYCGKDVVDPRTGQERERPHGYGTYAGGNAAVLVVREDGRWIAYDSTLTEVWRADVVGDGNVYGFPDLPVALAVDMTTFAFHTVDLRTGEVTPTATTVLAADGYLEAEDEAGPLVARDFAGTVLGELQIGAPECIPPYGERQVLADRLECPADYEGDVDINGLNGFLLRAEGSPKALELAATGFTVDGEAFEAGDRGFLMAWMFGDEDHFLARFDAGWGLYATGSPDP
ncbi:MAG: hypothetical protein EOL89_12735, partial [Actinobacteria bacterium]|nr:hypothetical protein [Actinomycetota bacterium]